MSSDSVSSLFPDRPIRPLPKRRLRERLSPDVADTINFPKEPQSNAPLFYYPYSPKTESGIDGLDSTGVANKENEAGLAQQRNSGVRRASSTGVEEQGLLYQTRRSLAPRSLHDSLEHMNRAPLRASHGRHQNPQPPPSTASSADGYDSFENTNNKKKRKIPTAGEGVLNGAHSLSDSSALGIPSPPNTGDEESGDAPTAASSPYTYAGNLATGGQGISGPGRGRFGRNRNGRSPLRQVPDPNSNWPVKHAKPKPGGHYPASAGENAGIISNAIASAEKLSVSQGQENISLLQQQASSKTSPASAQFTFTFDSQVPGTVPWPGSDSTSPQMADNFQDRRGIGHSTSRDLHHGPSTRAAQQYQASQPVLAGAHTSVPSNTDGVGQTAIAANTPPKKPKRRGNPLLQAAKQRRQEQEYKNYHHPPPPADVWICEFCEYERIFGRPPEALIRQYEIKDRRRRMEEAERRRLLEKAKMKSRKGKKPGRLPAKNSGPAQDRNSAPTEHQAPLMDNESSQEAHREDLAEEPYYEAGVNDELLPSAAAGQDFETHASSMAAHVDHGGSAQGHVGIPNV